MLQEGLAKGDVAPLEDPSDRRQAPRFQVKSRKVWIKVQRQFRVVDLSIAGIAVVSDFPFEVGHTIHITLGKAFAVEATVRDCVPDPEGPTGTGGYRISCRFEEESVGMQFLVMLRQFDELELTLEPGALEQHSG